MHPGIGVEISPNGLMFLMPEKIEHKEYNLVLRIADHKIPVRVRNVRNDQVSHHGRMWNRYMFEFLGVAADNWDRICRYVNDEAEPVDRRKMQNQEMAKHPDDAYRLLPMAIQQKIVQMLIQKNRLDAPHAGQTPLLKLFHGGLIKRSGAKPAHRINVHSRKTINDDGKVAFA